MYKLQLKGVDTMKIKFQKWGKYLNIKQEEKIIISVPKKKKISLEERFKNYHGDNLVKDFFWDDPIGKEIW